MSGIFKTSAPPSSPKPAEDRRLCQIVTTWPFLLSLATLIINDRWLKQAHPGWVTGKLSDFAGIAVVSLLLLAALPQRRRLVAGAVVIGFSWWKSPLSQFAIDVLNAHLSSIVGRTVDYTDLSAFLVMPACMSVTSRPQAFVLAGHAVRRMLLTPVAALTALALMATTVMPIRQDYQVRSSEGAPDLDRNAIAETIAQVAALYGLQCEDCTNKASTARFRGDGLRLWYEFVGARSIRFEVDAFPSGTFFGPGGQVKADRLRDALRSRLASDHRDLEYVERLDPKAADVWPPRQ